jgi:Ser/Thr protein kinase RdoA (MazF antagonist)
VEVSRPSAAILREAGLAVLPGEIRPREGRAWRVDWRGTQGVLRQVSAPAPGPLVGQVTWRHAFLARLAGLGFPAPRPLPCFDGTSWATGPGAVWEVVSFVPGQVVGWAAEPPLEEIGALLARYHAAARQVAVTGQCPGALPLADVPAVLLSPQLEAAHVGPDRAAAIRRQAERLAGDLSGIGHLAGERVVIHGDFTNHNVIAAGTPSRAAGVIDFALAHAETPLADIGYGLWRSGRPRQDADHLDLSRIRRFVAGYASTARLSADEARAITVYLGGRGLQMIAKRVRAGRAETGMLAQVQWISAHAGAVGDALASAAS